MLSRLKRIEDLVTELSFQNDADRLVRAFGRQGRLFHDSEGLVTVNCRNLDPPRYRISRSWRWVGQTVIDPYAEPHLLPVYDSGLLGELLHAGRPVLIDDLNVSIDDPAREHLEGMRSLACAPSYDHGRVLGLSVILNSKPGHFGETDLETLLLNTNLLGRAAGVLALSQQLEQAYRRLDHEMEQVGRMQRHLLPAELPRPEGINLAASYVTCSRAGGDYYDVLPLTDDRCALLLVDVSGHGVAAAVVVGILHTLMHANGDLPPAPDTVLQRLNEHLVSVAPDDIFATAFYGVFDGRSRELTYGIAGHPAPRLRRGKSVKPLDGSGLPLGVLTGQTWPPSKVRLLPGDALLLYTDGLIEGFSPSGESFGMSRLDEALRMAPPSASALVHHIERRFRDFTGGGPAQDDRTLLALVGVP